MVIAKLWDTEGLQFQIIIKKMEKLPEISVMDFSPDKFKML